MSYSDTITVYAIRRKADGLWYKKGKRRYGTTQRTPWGPEPAKAWMTFDRSQIVRWSGLDKEAPGVLPDEYEVIAFRLIEAPR